MIRRLNPYEKHWQRVIAGGFYWCPTIEWIVKGAFAEARKRSSAFRFSRGNGATEWGFMPVVIVSRQELEKRYAKQTGRRLLVERI